MAMRKDIAVVGLGLMTAGATNHRDFWHNVLTRTRVLGEIPRHRWDWRIYYDADRSARDRIYSKVGGFIEDVPFDPLDYGIPPNSMKSIDPTHLLTLETVRQSLQDAGYLQRGFDRENTSVILGATLAIGEFGQRLIARSELPQLMAELDPDALDRMPEWSESSMTGYLLNVLAGRVANRLDLGGTNQTVDAACASALAAVASACQQLIFGAANVAIAGGVDAHQSPFAYLSLSKAQALSPSPRPRAFDKKADGIVLGESVGTVVLRRYEDAVADGDRIYAVIKGFGSSSDGRAKSLFSPYPQGQARALRRAYDNAGFAISTVGLLEAHGTGTVAGDHAEVQTIIEELQLAGAEPGAVNLHSLKSQVGHTKGAAGIVSLISTCLALHHRTRPPQMEVDEPLDLITDPASPVYLTDRPQPWLPSNGHPRRAGVSAFGFGGTNFHMVLEEASSDGHLAAHPSPDWSHELVVFRGENRADLHRQAAQVLRELENGARPRLCDLAAATIRRAWSRPEAPATLALVVTSLAHLARSLQSALPHLDGTSTRPLARHIHLFDQQEARGAKVALLFPGQGSQYPNQTHDQAGVFPEIASALGHAHRLTRGKLPRELGDVLFPPAAFTGDDETAQFMETTDPRFSMMLLMYYSFGMVDLLEHIGLRVDAHAGLSLGSGNALLTAGATDVEHAYEFMLKRMDLMHEFALNNPGDMLAINVGREEALEFIKPFEDVYLANVNSNHQVVISGRREVMNEVRQELTRREIRHVRVQLEGSYHCPLFGDPLEPELQELAAGIEVQLPLRRTVYAGRSAEPVPETEEAIRDEFAHQLVELNDWVKVMERLYDDGFRVFVEVGPRAVMTNLSDSILGDNPHWALSMDGQGGGMRGFLNALARLAGLGVEFDLTALYERREIQPLDLDTLAESTRPTSPRGTTWWINGGNMRPMHEETGHLGNQPALTRDEIDRHTATQPGQATGDETAQPAGHAGDEPPPQPVFPADADPDSVMAEYQRRMRDYLERQEAAMQAYMEARQRRKND